MSGEGRGEHATCLAEQVNFGAYFMADNQSGFG
jgi:hypothetical protein